MLFQTIGAFFAVVTLSIMFSVPRRYLKYTGVVGAVGWFIYLLMDDKLKQDAAMAVFVATLIVALIAHTFARVFKAPVTMFLIPGIVPLVPGIGMYRMAYYMFAEDSALTSYYFNYVLQVAGMIALAVFIMDTVFRVFQKS